MKPTISRFTEYVTVEDEAEEQIQNIASLPVTAAVAIMPDAHWGHGACVGSVIGTRMAIIPSAVGVDIGCGMVAARTTLRAEHLPDNLHDIRSLIEAAVPHGRTNDGQKGDRGAWDEPPPDIQVAAVHLADGFKAICEKHPKLATGNTWNHLGTLGTGNHFIEVCLDKEGSVWVMLHSGSRGVGNRIGSYFTALAKARMKDRLDSLPDKNLAWLDEGSQEFSDYVEALGWAQNFAKANRAAMLARVLSAIRASGLEFSVTDTAINCHHNYASYEVHFGESLWVTRKGAVSAKKGELGIIPGSMGAKSYIVCGKGHEAAMCSCSHGAGRSMSRTEAKKKFTIADLETATAGVECRKDADVIDEIPMAYKDIDAVMKSQTELVDVVAELKQVLCVKG